MLSLRQLERDDQQGVSPEVTVSGMSLVSESSRLGYDLSHDEKQHCQFSEMSESMTEPTNEYCQGTGADVRGIGR